MTLIEAFVCGLPIVASRLGAMAELVDEGYTGLLFRPGDPQDLATKVRWAVEHPAAMALMGAHARQVYEARYTADLNYNMLVKFILSHTIFAADPKSEGFLAVHRNRRNHLD
jgi:glycosyltransferase involved in cell wall biosynthesis